MKGMRKALLLALGLFSAAADAADEPQNARAAIDAAIEEEQGTRSLSVFGMVMGGLIITAGVYISAEKTVDEENEQLRTTGQYDGKTEMEAAWIGTAVGGGLMALSVVSYINAGRHIRTLEQNRARLSLAPVRDGAMLGLAYNF